MLVSSALGVRATGAVAADRAAACGRHTLDRDDDAPQTPHLSRIPSVSPARPNGTIRSAPARRLLRGRGAGWRRAAGVAYRRGGWPPRNADVGLPRIERRSALALGWGDGVSQPDHVIVQDARRGSAGRVGPRGQRPRGAGRRAPPLLGLQPRDLASRGPPAPRAGLPRRALRPARPRSEHQGHGAADDRDAGARPRQPCSSDATVRDAVLAGHSMGGMTIMSLATHRPDVLPGSGRKATVLVATAATSLGDRSAQARTDGRRHDRLTHRHAGDAHAERPRLRALRLRRESGRGRTWI